MPADSFCIRSEVVVLAKKPFSKKLDPFPLRIPHNDAPHWALGLEKKKKRDQTSETSQQPLGEGTQAARHLGTLGKRRAALRFLLGTRTS